MPAERVGTRDIGVIAQEVQAQLPLVVDTLRLPSADAPCLGVRYERLVPYLLAAVRRLDSEVRELRARLDSL